MSSADTRWCRRTATAPRCRLPRPPDAPAPEARPMPPASTSVVPVLPDQVSGGDGARRIANPLREGLRLERIPEPCTMVICGATGDLTTRKLGPALYNLMLGGFLPPVFYVLGFALRPTHGDAFLISQPMS